MTSLPRGALKSSVIVEKRDEVMTMDELAEYLKISKSTLYKLAQANKSPGQKIGKRWRFHKEAVDRWVQNDPGRSGGFGPGDQNK